MDGRRMNDLREEIGMQFSLTGRIVRRWMMWAGQGVWMETTKECRGGEKCGEEGCKKDGGG